MTQEQYEIMVKEIERELDDINATTIRKIERLYMEYDKVEIPNFINK